MTLCVILNITAAVGFVITFVQCDPAAGQWNPFQHPRTRCWERVVQIVYSCTVSGTYFAVWFYDISIACSLNNRRRYLGVHGYCVLLVPLHCRLGLADANVEEDQYDGLDEPWCCVGRLKKRPRQLTSWIIRCFVIAVIKLTSNTALLGDPDIYKLLSKCALIAITLSWN